MGVQPMNHVVLKGVVVEQDICHVLSFVPVMENQDVGIPTTSTFQWILMLRMTTNVTNWMKMTCLWTNAFYVYCVCRQYHAYANVKLLLLKHCKSRHRNFQSLKIDTKNARLILDS